MIALITGDIVNSQKVNARRWTPVLRGFLNELGHSPGTWEIFRGDSFQFKCGPETAFEQYLLLKSTIKQFDELDVRVSIGIGTIEYDAKKMSESNGSAFIRSGRAFDEMKGKRYLAFSTGDDFTDKTMNLFAAFASLITDNWSVAVAETVRIILENPGRNQAQIAESLKINQSAVSQNRKRAQLDLLLELNSYYKTILSSHYPK